MSPPTVMKLTDDNYAEWTMVMKALLTRRALWEVVEKPADETRPSGSDNTKAVKAWRVKIAEAHSEIVLNVDPSQYGHINSEDAHETWVELKRVHQARGFGTRVALRRSFWRMSMTTDQTMTSWISSVRRAAWRLKAIDAKLDNEDVILVLTNGLPPSYSQLIVNLDSTPPSELTINYVTARLLSGETRQLATNPGAGQQAQTTAALNGTVDVAAAAHPRTPIEKITCFNCGKKGHYQRNCPKPRKENAAAAAPKERNEAW